MRHQIMCSAVLRTMLAQAVLAEIVTIGRAHYRVDVVVKGVSLSNSASSRRPSTNGFYPSTPTLSCT